MQTERGYNREFHHIEMREQAWEDRYLSDPPLLPVLFSRESLEILRRKLRFTSRSFEDTFPLIGQDRT